jgi:hypothetical protein
MAEITCGPEGWSAELLGRALPPRLVRPLEDADFAG